MIKTTSRPFELSEQRLLSEWLAEPDRAPLRRTFPIIDPLGFLALLLVGSALGLVAGAYLQEVVGVRHGLAISLAAANLTAIGLGVQIHRREDARTANQRAMWRGKFEQDLKNGLAEVLHCTAENAAWVYVDEDVGMGLFVDAGDQQLLYLQGDYLDELTDWIHDLEMPATRRPSEPKRDRLPNTDFVIVRAPISRQVLYVDCRGESFAPAFEADESLSAELDFPQDGEFFVGELADLRSALRRRV